MVRMATEHSEWITVDKWESKGNVLFVDFPKVSRRLITELRRIYCDEMHLVKRTHLVLYYACGLHHAQKCGLLNGRLYDMGIRTLVLRRPTKELDKVKLKTNWAKHVVVVDAPPVD